MEQRERRQWLGEVLSDETPCERRLFPYTDIRERWLVNNWILKLSQPQRVTSGDRSGDKEGKDWVKFAMKTLAHADRFSCTARFTDRSQYVLPQTGRDGKFHNTGFSALYTSSDLYKAEKPVLSSPLFSHEVRAQKCDPKFFRLKGWACRSAPPHRIYEWINIYVLHANHITCVTLFIF